jgi:hypothetical protein
MTLVEPLPTPTGGITRWLNILKNEKHKRILNETANGIGF